MYRLPAPGNILFEMFTSLYCQALSAFSTSRQTAEKFGLTPDRMLDDSGSAYLPARDGKTDRRRSCDWGEGNAVWRRLEERPGFRGAKQQNNRGLGGEPQNSQKYGNQEKPS